ncbi:MAG: gluconolaconase, partial [Candidatus Aminicenantes bacterium]|nr:gluconolaconase [Candidatus Aminicenantes bacterium]
MKAQGIQRTWKTASAVGVLTVVGLCFLYSGCGKKPDWAAKNGRLIADQKLATRTRDDIPAVRLKPNLADGVVANIASLPAVELAPGVKARLYWGKGNLVAWLTFDPGATTAEETLPAERIMVVTRGEVGQLLGGNSVTVRAIPRETPDGTHGGTPKNEFVYLEKGSKNCVQAGSGGAEIVEVYWPPRPDYLAKAGAEDVPTEFPSPVFPVAPTVRPGVVYDLHDVQFTELQPGANSCLIGGHGAQLSFLQMSPGMNFAAHLHPEEQLMIVLRGSIDELILDATATMKKGDLLYLPGTMVHGGTVGDAGCDVLDVFFPPRPDYMAKKESREAAFQAIIPADSKVELLIDGSTQGPGLIFTEGPKWLKGKLYFSSMAFDGAWNGDPKKSATVEMDSDGTYRYIQRGMLTNGLVPL